MASVASRKLFTGKPSYSISKHAQGALTEAFRHELRPLGIRVTNVMPDLRGVHLGRRRIPGESTTRCQAHR